MSLVCCITAAMCAVSKLNFLCYSHADRLFWLHVCCTLLVRKLVKLVSCLVFLQESKSPSAQKLSYRVLSPILCPCEQNWALTRLEYIL